jgi:hypothetical protein
VVPDWPCCAPLPSLAADDALKAVNSEHCIDGRKCEAKFALPEGKVGSARTTRIFVARIPSSVSDAQFRSYFEQASAGRAGWKGGWGSSKAESGRRGSPGFA